MGEVEVFGGLVSSTDSILLLFKLPFKQLKYTMQTIKVSRTLNLILSLLENGLYKKLYELDMAKELTANDLSEFIIEYGGKITRPSDRSYDFDFYPIDGTNEVHIDYDLLADGKPSDLTIQCRMADDDSTEFYQFAIQSIHIL